MVQILHTIVSPEVSLRALLLFCLYLYSPYCLPCLHQIRGGINDFIAEVAFLIAKPLYYTFLIFFVYATLTNTVSTAPRLLSSLLRLATKAFSFAIDGTNRLSTLICAIFFPATLIAGLVSTSCTYAHAAAEAGLVVFEIALDNTEYFLGYLTTVIPAISDWLEEYNAPPDTAFGHVPTREEVSARMTELAMHYPADEGWVLPFQPPQQQQQHFWVVPLILLLRHLYQGFTGRFKTFSLNYAAFLAVAFYVLFIAALPRPVDSVLAAPWPYLKLYIIPWVWFVIAKNVLSIIRTFCQPSAEVRGNGPEGLLRVSSP